LYGCLFVYIIKFNYPKKSGFIFLIAQKEYKKGKDQDVREGA